jgi:hypothetical protein
MAYSAAKGRSFAFTLGTAFALVGGLSYWRAHRVSPIVFGAIALICLVAGAAVPSRLERAEGAWMRLAHAISLVTTPIFLGVVYFVILTPVAVIRRVAGGNPLVHRARNNSFWVTREAVNAKTLRRKMERQF